MLFCINSFRKLLLRKQKIMVFFFLVFSFADAILETVSVAIIIPVIQLMMDDAEENVFFQRIHLTGQTLIVYILILMALLFIVKNLVYILLSYVQSKLICDMKLHAQDKILQSIMQKSYEDFTELTTSEVIRQVLGDVIGSFTLFSTVLDLVIEVTVSAVLVITMVVINSEMTLWLGLLLLILMGFLVFGLKPRLKRMGARSMKYATETNKWLIEIVSGIKEIMVYQKENFFKERFKDCSAKGLQLQKINAVITRLPRVLIESICVSGVLAYIVIKILQGAEVAMIIPMLSAFVLAAVRLMPAANRISAYANQISYYLPQLERMMQTIIEAEDKYNISDYVNTEKKVYILDHSLKDIILKNVSFRYKGGADAVLENVSVTIPAGKSVGIIGSSGAGKTTAMDIVLGLLQPSEGCVIYDGVDIRAAYERWLNLVGYIPQMIYMLDGTIRENVAFGVNQDKIDEKKVWSALENAHISDFVKSLPQGLETKIGERGIRLSGGQRQRIGVARALYREPQILFFDEATSALDNDTESAIMESINELKGKKTLIIIAHRLQTIANCDLVYRVEGKKMVLDNSVLKELK